MQREISPVPSNAQSPAASSNCIPSSSAPPPVDPSMTRHSGFNSPAPPHPRSCFPRPFSSPVSAAASFLHVFPVSSLGFEDFGMELWTILCRSVPSSSPSFATSLHPSYLPHLLSCDYILFSIWTSITLDPLLSYRQSSLFRYPLVYVNLSSSVSWQLLWFFLVLLVMILSTLSIGRGNESKRDEIHATWCCDAPKSFERPRPISLTFDHSL